MGCVIVRIASMTTAGSKSAGTTQSANAHPAVTVNTVTMIAATCRADRSNFQSLHNPSQDLLLLLLSLPPIILSLSPPVLLLVSVQSVGSKRPHVDSCILIARKMSSHRHIGPLAKRVQERSTLPFRNVPFATSPTTYSALFSTTEDSNGPRLEASPAATFFSLLLITATCLNLPQCLDAFTRQQQAAARSSRSLHPGRRELVLVLDPSRRRAGLNLGG